MLKYSPPTIQPKRLIAIRSVTAIRSITVIAAFALIGFFTLHYSHAATPAVASEAESGTIAGNASMVSDSSASGGSAVTFGSGSSGGGSSTCSSTSTVKPDATNTGAPTSGLTLVNGNVTVTTAGTVIDNEDIKGFLNISASNVTVKNTIVRGGTTSANQGFVNVKSGSGILLDHITVLPTTKQVSLDGVWGNNFTLLCSNISGGVDGMKVSSNSTIKNNYVHDLAYFSSDPNQGGSNTHNDTIQILDGNNIVVQGNNLVAVSSNNSAIQVTQDDGPVSDLVVQNNWADGGGCTFNFAWKGGSSMAVTANNNRFGRNSSYNCPILIGTKVTLTQSGNVWDDTGQPVPVQQHD